MLALWLQVITLRLVIATDRWSCAVRKYPGAICGSQTWQAACVAEAEAKVYKPSGLLSQVTNPCSWREVNRLGTRWLRKGIIC